jgi:predicted ester cyclase
MWRAGVAGPRLSSTARRLMPSRSELASIATQWVSLWCAPLDWQLFDRLHSAQFQDCSSAGRPPTKEGFAGGLAEMIRAFPDLQTKVEHLVVDEQNWHRDHRGS